MISELIKFVCKQTWKTLPNMYVECLKSRQITKERHKDHYYENSLAAEQIRAQDGINPV